MVTGVAAATYPQVTLNKVSGGVTYPLSVSAVSGYAAGANWPAQETKNLLPGPITLATGESITITANTTPSVIELASTTLTSSVMTPTNAFYLNGYWCITGVNVTTNQAVIYYSTNGTTWTESGLGWWAAYPRCMAYGNGYYVVASGGNDPVYYATNIAGPWTAVTTAASAAGINGLAYAAGRFIIVSNSGIYVSPSNVPTSYSVLSWGQYYAWYDCIEVGGKAVFSGSQAAQIGTTSDFVNFSGFGVITSALNAYNIDARRAQFANAIDQTTGYYYIKVGPVTAGSTAGNPCALRSTDGGVTWSPVNIPSSGYSYGSNISNLQEQYLISGANNAHHVVIDSGTGSAGRANWAYSADNGVTWTATSSAAMNTSIFQNNIPIAAQVFPGTSYALLCKSNGAEPYGFYQITASGITQIFVSGGSGFLYWNFNQYPLLLAYNSTNGVYWAVYYDANNGGGGLATTSNPASGLTYQGYAGYSGPITAICSRSGTGVIFAISSTIFTNNSVSGYNIVYSYSSGISGTVTSLVRNGTTIYASTTNGQVIRSTDDGVTWANVGPASTLVPDYQWQDSSRLNYDTTRSRYISTLVSSNSGGNVMQSTNGTTWTGWIPISSSGGFKLAATANYIYLFGNSTSLAYRIPISGATGSQIPVSYASVPSANKWRVQIPSNPNKQAVVLGTSIYSIYSSQSTLTVNPSDASSASLTYSYPASGINGLKYLEWGTSGVNTAALATDGTSILVVATNSSNTTMNTGGAVVGTPTTPANILGAGAVTLGIVEQT
jgi:hypothetical protein